MNDKRTLFLAGDSTVQSYGKNVYPQSGWGQQLWRFFKGSEDCRTYVRSDAPASHVVTYELPDFKIENHAFAARSSRSFYEQGRLEEIFKVAGPGDFLAIQFAHNDAFKEREERYVPVEKYAEWIGKYNTESARRGITCIFITPVTMRVFDEKERCLPAFDEYAREMRRCAAEWGVPLVDLSKMSTELVTNMGKARSRDMYLWLYPGEYPDSDLKNGAEDNAHFQEYGAQLMAELVARGPKSLDDDKTGPLRNALADSFVKPEFTRILPENFRFKDDDDMTGNAKEEILARN